MKKAAPSLHSAVSDTTAVRWLAAVADSAGYCRCCCIAPIQEIDPRPPTWKQEVFSILVVISLVGTISGKSLKLLPPDVIF